MDHPAPAGQSEALIIRPHGEEWNPRNQTQRDEGGKKKGGYALRGRLSIACYFCRGELDLDSVIVLGADPVHSAWLIAILDHLCRHHTTAALGTGVFIVMTLVAHACACRLRDLFSHKFALPASAKNHRILRVSARLSISFPPQLRFRQRDRGKFGAGSG